MTDSAGDGWSGNIFGIRQMNENNALVGTFGSTFTTGATAGPLSITVEGIYQTQIFVFALGTKTDEIGFVITAPNGTQEPQIQHLPQQLYFTLDLVLCLYN